MWYGGVTKMERVYGWECGWRGWVGRVKWVVDGDIGRCMVIGMCGGVRGVCTHTYIHNKISLNRPTTGPTLSCPFREAVGVGS